MSGARVMGMMYRMASNRNSGNTKFGTLNQGAAAILPKSWMPSRMEQT